MNRLFGKKKKVEEPKTVNVKESRENLKEKVDDIEMKIKQTSNQMNEQLDLAKSKKKEGNDRAALAALTSAPAARPRGPPRRNHRRRCGGRSSRAAGSRSGGPRSAACGSLQPLSHRSLLCRSYQSPDTHLVLRDAQSGLNLL